MRSTFNALAVIMFLTSNNLLAEIIIDEIDVRQQTPNENTIIGSLRAIQGSLINNCNARPDCHKSLALDKDYAERRFPKYNPDTVLNRAELERLSRERVRIHTRREY